MVEIHAAVSISRCTFPIHRMKTRSVLLEMAFRLVSTSWSTEFKTDAAGSARFIDGKIGLRVASQSRTKRSRSCGGSRRTAPQSRFVLKALRVRAALFGHRTAGE